MLEAGERHDLDARRAFYRLAGRYALALAVQTPLGVVHVPTNDDVIGERTFVNGSFEADTTAAALALLRTLGALPTDLGGRDILEVGANIGTQTLAFAQLPGAGRVIALEPAPSTAGLLRATVAANDLTERVTVLPVAASDADGIVSMEANPANIGDWRVEGRRMVDGQMGEAAWEHVAVQARQLDSLTAEGAFAVERLAFAWMDCQGHEGHILAGGRRLLASDVPIVCEFWPYGLRRADGLERFASLVRASGRRVYDLRGEDAGGPALVDSSDLLGLSDRYGPPRFTTVDAAFTDLVLVR